MSRNEWLLDRAKSIGGSDAPVILNNKIPVIYDHKFGQLHRIWASKLPVIERYSLEMPSDSLDPVKHRRMIQGTNSEPLCREYIGKYNRSVATECFQELYRRDDFPMLHGSIDGEMTLDGEVCGIEIKTLGTRAKWWGSTVPYRVELQSRHNWFCRPSLKRFLVCAFKADDAIWDAVIRGAMPIEKGVESDLIKFAQWELEPTDFYEKECIKHLVSFWNDYVITGEVPNVDSTKECKDVLDSLYEENDGLLEVTAEIESLIQKKIKADESYKEAKKIKDLVRNEFLKVFGGKKRLNSDRFSVSVSRQVRTDLNKSKLLKDHPNLYESYLTETSFTKLNFTEKGKGRDEKK